MTLWFLAWWAQRYSMWETDEFDKDIRPVEYQVCKRIQLQAKRAALIRFGFMYKVAHE